MVVARLFRFVLLIVFAMGLHTILVLGFFLGMRHATDADHVVAVATIVSRERSLRAAAPIGMAWGFGHTATILAVGGAILAFDVVITPRLGLSMELVVAAMLVLLGALSMRNLVVQNRHGHTHDLERADRWFGRSRIYRLVRPLLVGVVHGMAGSAAVALLVLGTVHDLPAGLLYLLVFGAGTIAGMLLITLAFATPLSLSARHFARLHSALVASAAASSVAFGAYLFYDICFVHGLLTTSSPEWTAQ